MRPHTVTLLVALSLVPVSLVPGPAFAQTGEYPIGPRDLLEIRVLEIPDLNVERRVADNGTLDLPLLGAVNVSGLSASDVRDRLSAMLTAKYVNRANVSVIVKDYASKPVWVMGAVQRPGPLTISGRWDLQQAILAAGGLAVTAGRRISILRKAENGLTDRLEVNADELFVRSSPIWNVPVFPSDLVTVQPKTALKVFLLGEFRSPGVLEFLDDRVTLLGVIARAGGFTDRASKSKIRVKRRAADGKETELVYDYKRIVDGKERDPEILADDVIIVKESFF